MSPPRTYLTRTRTQDPTRTTGPRRTTPQHPATGRPPARTSRETFPPLTLSIR